jgi:CHAD domain-containing protein
MPYRLKRSEPVPEAIKRAAAEQMAEAAGQLAKDDPEIAVHEARRCIKKTRALLALVRGELGRIYRRENTCLRNVGRELSELRDAGAMLRTFDSLIEKHEAGLERGNLGGIRRGLESRKRAAEQAAHARQAMARAIVKLQGVRERALDWPLRADAFPALAQGLEASYRRGRRSLKRAMKNQSTEDFHELRKSVKQHWHHMRLLESSWTMPIEARAHGLKELADWLGDEHNLAVLSEQLEKDPASYGDEAEIKLFLALAAQERQELQANSIALGCRLYEEKPRLFIRQLAKHWDAWKAQKRQPAKRKPPVQAVRSKSQTA